MIGNAADQFHFLCSRGECPFNMDSFSDCPVMNLASKSCCEITRDDWIHWVEEFEKPDSLYRKQLSPDLAAAILSKG